MRPHPKQRLTSFALAAWHVLHEIERQQSFSSNLLGCPYSLTNQKYGHFIIRLLSAATFTRHPESTNEFMFEVRHLATSTLLTEQLPFLIRMLRQIRLHVLLAESLSIFGPIGIVVQSLDRPISRASRSIKQSPPLISASIQ
jgi:hypothetical protein